MLPVLNNTKGTTVKTWSIASDVKVETFSEKSARHTGAGWYPERVIRMDSG
jgi:hypothetical protein